MSLVHEALQKAEREKLRKAGVAPSAPAPVATTHPTVHTSTAHTPVVTVSVTPLAPEPIAHEPAPVVDAQSTATSILLPALIGCVAIVAIIAIVFLVTNAASILRQSKESVSARPATSVAAPAPTPVAKTREPVSAQPAVQPLAEATALPTVPPPTVAVADESKYKLSGIMKDPDGKFVAVLNGRVAYEGYYIDGATVKKIERDRVTIDVHGREAVLRLF
jgi:hypothetical protein